MRLEAEWHIPALAQCAQLLPQVDLPDLLSLTIDRTASPTIAASISKTITVAISNTPLKVGDGSSVPAYSYYRLFDQAFTLLSERRVASL